MMAVLLVQVGGAIPTTPFELIRQATPLTKAVLIILAVLSLVSWAVIFGVWGSASSSFCSRTHLAARRVDSWACAEVSKSPTEVRTPPPASIR